MLIFFGSNKTYYSININLKLLKSSILVKCIEEEKQFSSTVMKSKEKESYGQTDWQPKIRKGLLRWVFIGINK